MVDRLQAARAEAAVVPGGAVTAPRGPVPDVRRGRSRGAGGTGPPLAAAAERIRDSAKWLLGSFAAVGAILVAGLQLTGVGELEDGRLRWALGGLAVAVVGVVIAIGAAGAVVTKTFVTLKWLAQRPDGDPALDRIAGDKVVLGGYGSGGRAV